MNTTHTKHTDLSVEELIAHAIAAGEGVLANNGALVVKTGRRTSRYPEDRFIVREPGTDEVIEWGESNQSFAADVFDNLWSRVKASFAEGTSYLTHLHVGAGNEHYLPVAMTSETAWHALFARSQFITPESFNPKEKQVWRLLHAPSWVCDPATDGTHSDGAVIINFARRRILIIGMAYAGELKKALFSVQNLVLPEKDVLPVQCAANVGSAGDVCLFFGLSGSGKTTLSVDPDRPLIGDDEHGWARETLFNLESGCYTRCANLSPETDPVFSAAIGRGTILENVVLDDDGNPDYSNDSLTTNIRACIPREVISDCVPANSGPEPTRLVFLTCDPTGTIPLVSCLSPDEAAYHFLSGYTAQGDETGDEAFDVVFSTCFGASFFPRSPEDYASLLKKRIEESGARAFLLNTGWIGNGAEEGAERVPVPLTRTVVGAIHAGALDHCTTTRVAPLDLAVPDAVPGVDPALLNPAGNAMSPRDFSERAAALAAQFAQNFERFHSDRRIAATGPGA